MHLSRWALLQCMSEPKTLRPCKFYCPHWASKKMCYNYYYYCVANNVTTRLTWPTLRTRLLVFIYPFHIMVKCREFSACVCICTQRSRGTKERGFLWQESSCSVMVTWQRRGDSPSELPLLRLKFWHSHSQQQQWCNLVTSLLASLLSTETRPIPSISTALFQAEEKSMFS